MVSYVLATRSLPSARVANVGQLIDAWSDGQELLFGNVISEYLSRLKLVNAAVEHKGVAIDGSSNRRISSQVPELHNDVPLDGRGERIEIVRKAVRIVEEETEGITAFQCFAVLLKDRATGLKKDGSREFGHIIVVRCVESENAMTAEPVPLPWDVLRRLEHRIAGEIEEVSRVLYDLTPKPPATIEYI